MKPEPVPAPARPSVAEQAGMTLVEVLIAVVVAGLLGTAMFQLFQEQHQFYGETEDRLFAKQTLRATTDLAETELREASGGDVVAAQPDSIAVWHDEIGGYVCDVTAADVVYYYVHRQLSDPGTLGLLGDRGTAYSNPFSTTYEYDPDFDATGSETSLAQDACEAAGAPAGEPSSRYRAITWGGSLAPPQPGAVLRLYRELSYYFADSEMGDGTALWRNEQELAAPFSDADSGFRYRVCAGGSCGWHTSVSDESDQRNIVRVELGARALGDGANRYDIAVDLDYDISLRN